MPITHTHPCFLCHAPVECDGEYERNYDGWPDAICLAYHRPSGPDPDWLCDNCEAAHQADADQDEAAS